MEIKIGCCGFPTGRQKYYKDFGVVEIQKSFYQMPHEKIAEKWRRAAPEDFEFTLKAWQLITHEPSSPTYRKLTLDIPETTKKNYGFFKPTAEVFKAWEKTEEIAQVLGVKIIVFQCPKSFTDTGENKKNMQKFFKSVPKKRYIFAWEVRGNWKEDVIKNLCRELDLVHCVDPFKSKPLYGKIRYFRLHGKGGYKYKYSDKDLKELINFVRKDSPTYFMFNNVYMFEDAKKFKKLSIRKD